MTRHFLICFGNYGSIKRQAVVTLKCTKVNHAEGKNEKTISSECRGQRRPQEGLSVTIWGSRRAPSVRTTHLGVLLSQAAHEYSDLHITREACICKVRQKEVYSYEYTKRSLFLYYYLLITVLLSIQISVNLLLPQPACSEQNLKQRLEDVLLINEKR